jgi:hypothetical protein
MTYADSRPLLGKSRTDETVGAAASLHTGGSMHMAVYQIAPGSQRRTPVPFAGLPPDHEPDAACGARIGEWRVTDCHCACSCMRPAT